jgi:hypothetical protein
MCEYLQTKKVPPALRIAIPTELFERVYTPLIAGLLSQIAKSIR